MMMTSLQETLNAFTILLPTTAILLFYVLYLERFPENAARAKLLFLLLGSAMHMPVSFTYHLGVAFGRYPDRLDNDMRRLDQSLQHVAGTIFAFALSSGEWYCTFFTFLNLLLNSLWIIAIWRTKNDGKRWMSVFFSILLYTLPILFRNFRIYALTLVSVVVGGTAAFVPYINLKVMGGWGHCFFHLCLCVFAYALILSEVSV